MMLRSHKIRLCPTAAQESYFRRACGTSRFAYNWALAEWQRQYKAGEKPSESKLQKQLNGIKREEFPWMLEVTKVAVQQAIKNLGKAYSAAFFRCKNGIRRGKKNPFGFPQFKKKGRRDSFRADNGPQDKSSSAVAVDGKSITLPFCGTVRMREEVRFSGRIIASTVSRVADGWYVSLNIETTEKLQPASEVEPAVGVDLGIKTLATLSNGETFTPPKNVKLLRGRLRRLSRCLSRKKIGSANRAKAKTKLARLHNRMANVRKDALHKLTHKLATQFAVVAIEDLNVRGMVKNRNLARAVSDCGFFEFRRQLEYKCDMTGSHVHVVDRFYPSSKTCSGCGEIHDMPLSCRTMDCRCGLKLDRDLNAARNLMRQALPFKPVERPALAREFNSRVKLDSVKQEVGLSGNA